jgi:acyl transferase domain-containing protein
MHLGLARAGFLSPSGQCKSFDRDADGYARAEGCGLFVLKRLKDAVDDNDRIHGVIKAAEINQCGNARSITHPHLETQVKLFETLLAKARLGPESISVVETHGTGTQVGSPYYYFALSNGVFANYRYRQAIQQRYRVSYLCLGSTVIRDCHYI